MPDDIPCTPHSQVSYQLARDTRLPYPGIETQVQAEPGAKGCVMLLMQLCQLPGWDLPPQTLPAVVDEISRCLGLASLGHTLWEPGSSGKVRPSSLVNHVSQTVVAQMLPLEGFGPRASLTTFTGKHADAASISDIRELSQR